VRRFLSDAWRKRRDGLPATPLEIMAADVAEMHPEYHDLLATLVLAIAAAAPAFAAPETYVADSTHTFSRFSYSHFGYSTQLSRFNKNSGKVVFDKVAKTGSVDIVIDTKSVDTGYDTFNEHIQGEDFLDTAKYPTATFKSTKVIFECDKPAKVEGNLTLKGVTKPVTLTITSFQAMPHPMMKKDAIGANAWTVVKRSEFNAGKYAPYVGDEVRIDVAIEAIKE
jgi:polyisoprenoid-binding protein YceI